MGSLDRAAGRLFAWHHDGTEVADGDQNPVTDGILFRTFGSSFNYSSPAVCDLDGDFIPEILFAVNVSVDNSGPVFAIRPDGSLLPGWPFFTGGAGAPSQVTASIAVGDLDDDPERETVVVDD